MVLGVKRSRAAAQVWRQSGWLSLLVCALLCLPAAAADSDADSDSATRAAAALPEKYSKWFEAAEVLMTEAEREVFLDLEESYQRDHFIRRFWKVRDPFLATARNEFQEAFEVRVVKAREAFDKLTGERARMMLTLGVPSRRKPLVCAEMLKPLEVWQYNDGSDRIRGYFTLVFIGLPRSRGLHPLWQPDEGLSALVSAPGLIGGSDAQLAQLILGGCVAGDEVLAALAQSLDLSRTTKNASLLPQPNDEWVRTFAARSTAVPEGAELLSGELAVSFPGRHQSRTVVQGLLAVPKAELELAEVGEHRAYNLLIDGEILRQEDLFDQFRYRFSFPAEMPSEKIPLVVQRYLRPGQYQLIVKVEDQVTKRVYREERTIDVPRVEPGAVVASTVPAAMRPAALPGATPASSQDPSAALPSATPPGLSDGSLAAGTAAGTTDGNGTSPTHFAQQLVEANASISTGDHTIKILALPDILTVGRLRVEARVRGEGIKRVAFELDGRSVMRKTRPPYSVELNLGDKPRVHTLRVAALDDGGEELATDEVLINSGPHSFTVRLLEPQPGKSYQHSVRAHAEVEVPEGERLDRVELYLNETLMATLYQPPFEQPLLLDGGGDVTYVRSVAYLRDGGSAEDVRFINAPDYVDSVKVQFVELFTTVVDRKGNFIEDLALEDFSVFEDGHQQAVRRFEPMRDLPIRAGLVLDTSLSMMSDLRHVKTAAYRFFETVLTDRDRAALITFSDEPRLAVRFTNDKEILAGGLSELIAEGETALYDSIIFGLHYFSGLRGKRAIIVLTDGEDSTSHYSYEDATDFARRTGVAVYIIGLNLQSKDNDTRLKMRRLAGETGGELFLIDAASQLGKVYDTIQQELRSQYLIAYQSSQGDGEEFREVEIKSHRKGLEAKTIRGYFP